MLPLPILHDNVPNEGCEVVTLGVTAVSGGGVAVTDGGIYDVSAEAVVKIEEDDFVSAVREAVAPEGLSAEEGGLSPATAEVRRRESDACTGGGGGRWTRRAIQELNISIGSFHS